MKQMTRLAALILACMLAVTSACAEDWFTFGDSEGAVGTMTEAVGYDAASSVGTVTNGGRPDVTDDDSFLYSYTPIDAVLVIDQSGSMSATGNSSHDLLYYATTAAKNFSTMLMDLSPASRVAVVAYDDAVTTVLGLTGQNQKGRIETALDSISFGGNTNIGGGFQRAESILAQEGINAPVILLLTDGLANAGSANPQEYARLQGRSAAEDSLVFTFGLVGGMNSSDKDYARMVLNAGYEKRYFEIDFNSVDDVAEQIYSCFTNALAIAQVEYSNQPDFAISSMSTHGDLGVQVKTESGRFYSSDPASAGYGASFVTATSNGDEKQMLISAQEGFSVRVHGEDYGKASYSFASYGSGTGSRAAAQFAFDNHPNYCAVIDSVGGEYVCTELPVNPLERGGRDPFTGEVFHGTRIAAVGEAGAALPVYGLPGNKGDKLATINQGTQYYVLAYDNATGSSLVAYQTKGTYGHGWCRTPMAEVDGYVPNMVWLEGCTGVVAQNTPAYRAPDLRALKTEQISRGAKVDILFTLVGWDGREWAMTKTKKSIAYIPTNMISGWQENTADAFGLATDVDMCIDVELGKKIPFAQYANEQMDWHVVKIDLKNDSAHLVCTKAINVVQYHHSTSYTTWRNSDLRDWLNNNFYYTAFPAEIRGLIKLSNVEDSADYVYILSAKELEAYKKLVGGTFKLQSNELCKTKKTQTGREIYYNKKQGSVSWWLRSSATNGHADLVSGSGIINGAENPPTSIDNGVRPVIQLSLDYFRGHAKADDPIIPNAANAVGNQQQAANVDYNEISTYNGRYMRVTAANTCMLRSGPGTEYDKVGSIGSGQGARIISAANDTAGHLWLMIETSSYGACWIAAGVTDVK